MMTIKQLQESFNGLSRVCLRCPYRWMLFSMGLVVTFLGLAAMSLVSEAVLAEEPVVQQEALLPKEPLPPKRPAVRVVGDEGFVARPKVPVPDKPRQVGIPGFLPPILDQDRIRNEAELERQQMKLNFQLAKRGVILEPAQPAMQAPQQKGTWPAVGDPTPLGTNDEFERLLERADKLVEAGRADLAPLLWQRVLDEASSSLGTQSGGLMRTLRNAYQSHRPLRDEVERRIAVGGPSGLKAYRLHADPLAKGLLLGATDENRERLLEEIVRRYFHSGQGDNAALELACLALERHEDSAALRWLAKLKTHPESDIPPVAILLREAVALCRLHSAKAAAPSVTASQELVAVLEKLSPDHRSLVEAEIARTTSQSNDDSQRQEHKIASTVSGWPMFHGNATRNAFPADPLASSHRPDQNEGHLLKPAWDYRPKYDMKKQTSFPPPRVTATRRVIKIVNGQQVVVTETVDGSTTQNDASAAAAEYSRSDLSALWKRQAKWPVGQILMAGDRMLIKAEDRIVCCDTQSGHAVWMGRKSWFPLNALSQVSTDIQAQMIMRGGMPGYEMTGPRSRIERMLFDDASAQAMTVVGDSVVVLEGALNYPVAKANPKPSGVPILDDALLPARPRPGIWRPQPGVWMELGDDVVVASAQSVTARTWLTSYDLRTGKLRWHRSVSGNEKTGETGSFIGDPVSVGDLLLVPVLDGGPISIMALDVTSGSTLWKTPLCDVPQYWQPVSASIKIAADRSNAYISTGAGGVFCLSIANGNVCWATSYARRIPVPAFLQEVGIVFGGRGRLPQDNQVQNRVRVTENLVIRHDDLLLVLASDMDHVVALDSQTGAFRWEAPVAPSARGVESASYVGVLDGRLLLSGPKIVRAYGLTGGRIQWERPLDTGYGRPLLTSTTLYVPQNDEILRLDPKTGKELSVWKLDDPDGEPVGNLFTDGKRLFCLGAARVRLLSPSSPLPTATEQN